MAIDHTCNRHFRQVIQLTSPVKQCSDFKQLATHSKIATQKEKFVPSDYSIDAHADG